MTFDERLHFLVQSTEGLHANVQELHATVAAHARQIEQLTEAQKKTQSMLAEVSEDIRSLANIARIHQNRLDNQEGRVANLENPPR